ncbi:MAG: hypothetical protein P8H55_07675 [Hellea sp.]|nr:hypothetical protein [Hellea sp.]
MKHVSTTEKIFNTKLIALRRARAGKRAQSWLINRCVDDVVERIIDVNRSFDSILIIGANSLEDQLKKALPKDKYNKIKCINSITELSERGNFNIVISLLRLQTEDNVAEVLIKIHKNLKPDGLFIAAMFGGNTLTELRQVFYKTDNEIYGGLTPHIYPMTTYKQAAELLVRSGYNQPVVDSDRIAVNYSNLGRLINDLRDLGETNVLNSKSKQNLTKTYINSLTKNYLSSHSRKDGKLKCSFEILWLTGWIPHISQQKPLKPGTPKINFETLFNKNK